MPHSDLSSMLWCTVSLLISLLLSPVWHRYCKLNSLKKKKLNNKCLSSWLPNTMCCFFLHVDNKKHTISKRCSVTNFVMIHYEVFLFFLTICEFSVKKKNKKKKKFSSTSFVLFHPSSKSSHVWSAASPPAPCLLEPSESCVVFLCSERTLRMNVNFLLITVCVIKHDLPLNWE